MDQEQINKILEENKTMKASLEALLGESKQNKANEEVKENKVAKKTRREKKLLLGSALEEFSGQKLLELMTPATQIEAAKYVRTYFGTLHGGKKFPYVFWDAYDKEFVPLDRAGLGQYLTKTHQIVSIEGTKVIILFSAFNYITEELMTRYRFDCDPKQPKAFVKNGQFFLNQFCTMLHTEKKEYKSYPEHIKKYIDMMWNHIFDVWCSSKEEQFRYTKNWLCAMISGEKMTSCLYLRSYSEGIGKTIVTEFIKKNVLGEKATYTVDNPKILCGGFNYPLCGKLLACVEELPTNTTGEWSNLTRWFLSWVTNHTKEFERKMHDSFNSRNLTSLIALTNTDALKINSGDRRQMMLDTSNKYLGNDQYFDLLAQCLEGPYSHQIGEAFYWYCIEYNDEYIKTNGKNFNAQKQRPSTDVKRGTIIDHLHTLFIYLKKENLTKKKGIKKQLVTHFLKDYLKALSQDSRQLKNGFLPKYKNHDLNVTPRKISELLTDLGVITYNGTGNYKTIPETSYEDLYQMFMKKEWIDEYDDFQEENDDEEDKLEFNSDNDLLIGNLPKAENNESYSSESSCHSNLSELSELSEMDKLHLNKNDYIDYHFKLLGDLQIPKAKKQNSELKELMQIDKLYSLKSKFKDITTYLEKYLQALEDIDKRHSLLKEDEADVDELIAAFESDKKLILNEEFTSESNKFILDI